MCCSHNKHVPLCASESAARCFLSPFAPLIARDRLVWCSLIFFCSEEWRDFVKQSQDSCEDNKVHITWIIPDSSTAHTTAFSQPADGVFSSLEVEEGEGDVWKEFSLKIVAGMQEKIFPYSHISNGTQFFISTTPVWIHLRLYSLHTHYMDWSSIVINMNTLWYRWCRSFWNHVTSQWNQTEMVNPLTYTHYANNDAKENTLKQLYLQSHRRILQPCYACNNIKTDSNYKTI